MESLLSLLIELPFLGQAGKGAFTFGEFNDLYLCCIGYESKSSPPNSVELNLDSVPLSMEIGTGVEISIMSTSTIPNGYR